MLLQSNHKIIFAALLVWSTGLLVGCNDHFNEVPKPSLTQPGVTQSSTPTGTLRDKNGQIMRATPMVLSGNSEITDAAVADALSLERWQYIKSLGFNTIRLCLVDPYYELQTRWSYWTLQETLDEIDICVNNAQAAGMNIIINYHSVGEIDRKGENMDQAYAKNYWSVLAPRYADNDWVYYEISNETSFEEDTYHNPVFIQAYKELYDIVRAAAPNKQIIVFSWNSVNFDYQAIVNHFDTHFDWNYTTIGYHIYGSYTSTDKIQGLMQNYRVMCTEWDYPGSQWVPDNFGGNYLIAETMEELGNSWADWRHWGDTALVEIRDVLIPDAMQKGYWWGAGGNSAPTASITSPQDGASFNSGASITLDASASDADGTVTKIDFYANGTLLGTDTSAPYSYTWSPADGSYNVTAVATDDQQTTGTSAVVQITVGNATPTNIVNADFELGNLNGWSVTGTASISTDAQSGGSGATITDKDSKLYQQISVNPNTTYTVSVWCKKVDSQSGINIGVENYGGSTVSTQSWSSSWEQVSVTFTTGPTDTSATIFASPQRKNRTHLVDNWTISISN
ncbi:Ig-like domain-containing protein [Marinoscillum furvescens]|uniref:Aryl-phospho-beta-D-glucosidase BglC (GH1 family) n=1 Tax=Marinoscillum furvescens DSM 4134 TaxID=1122208 RepID=A0A3D9L614_MARFU|nr:Ig-like domain-containing protein [Marinoscillum furvescens]REE01534.1 aryl-phospho-beta-D-glucosidase BglC (GH1 family) [Marinoscillum furvescens DSM 4134]